MLEKKNEDMDKTKDGDTGRSATGDATKDAKIRAHWKKVIAKREAKEAFDADPINVIKKAQQKVIDDAKFESDYRNKDFSTEDVLAKGKRFAAKTFDDSVDPNQTIQRNALNGAVRIFGYLATKLDAQQNDLSPEDMIAISNQIRESKQLRKLLEIKEDNNDSESNE